MIGLDAVGFHAVGEMILGSPAPLYFEPVSRISSGGTFRPPAQVPTLVIAIHWDDSTIMTWDDDDIIEWDN